MSSSHIFIPSFLFLFHLFPAGLKLTEDGLLIDEKTGEVINEYGATRFDVAVRALQGDFDPPPTVENTERSSGIILDSLLKWPAVYEFQFVLNTNGAVPASLLEEMRAIVAKVCQWEVSPDVCSYKERKGGKFVSLCIPATVRYPELIQKVFQAVEKDDRIIMKY